MNVFFDLENGLYTDLIVQKEHEKNERKALCQMVDCAPISGKVILLADRNYEACNDLAHLGRKGWNCLIRIWDKDRAVAYGVELPDRPSFDIPVRITLGRLTKLQLAARGLAAAEPYYRLPPKIQDHWQPSFRLLRLRPLTLFLHFFPGKVFFACFLRPFDYSRISSVTSNPCHPIFISLSK